MKRANRQFKVIDGVFYKLCECGYCDEYFLIGITHGKERRFVRGHNAKGRTGKNSNRYKDGHCLKEEEWKDTVKEHDHFTCQKCGVVKRKGSVYLHAHHIKSKEEYPELKYDINNGRTLCNRCHGYLHNIGKHLSKETIEKMSMAKMGNEYCLGLHPTKETIEKMSKSKMGNNYACKNKD